MKLEQFYGLVNKLVYCEKNGKLTEKETDNINHIIKYHDNAPHYDLHYRAETLFFIAPNLIPRELTRVGKILLSHQIYLPCEICGDEIRSSGHLSIDHIKPISKGGGNFMPNTGFAHKRCNKIKTNILLDVDEYGQIDRTSPEFLEIIISIKFSEREPRKKPHTRPAIECSHAKTFSSYKTYYNNRVNSEKNIRRAKQR